MINLIKIRTKIIYLCPVDLLEAIPGQTHLNYSYSQPKLRTNEKSAFIVRFSQRDSKPCLRQAAKRLRLKLCQEASINDTNYLVFANNPSC